MNEISTETWPTLCMRNIHDKSNRAGIAVGTGQENQGYVFNYKDNIPDPNMRNIHDKSNRAGVAVGTAQENQGYV